MEPVSVTVLLFLSSGLFLGWSLGANDASNVFGTAVATRMVRFSTAAFICSVFVIIGAVIGGAGAAGGLGELGSVNALAGSFTAAFSAALTVFWMTRLGLPVSTTQAIVGAIIGWNFFSGSITDFGTLIKIVGTWVACPILGAIFSIFIYKFVVAFLNSAKLHLLTLDFYTRWGLILAGAFGSYALGANNIGNVMGVFVSASPFTDFNVGGLFHFTSVQQLFLIGAIAIAIGVYTYSKRVMMTVGNSLITLNPVGAFVVVISHSLVLFVFSSSTLESFLVNRGLPSIPLIPVSSSQAVVGAVLGIGLLKGFKGIRQIKWNVLINIASGWVSTPIIAAMLGFVMLFIVQNVFNQPVYEEVYFQLSDPVLEYLANQGVSTETLMPLKDREIAKPIHFRNTLREQVQLEPEQEQLVLSSAEIYPISIDETKFPNLNQNYMSSAQIQAIKNLLGQSFSYQWQFQAALSAESAAWRKKAANRINKIYNQKLNEQLNYVERFFKVDRDANSNLND